MSLEKLMQLGYILALCCLTSFSSCSKKDDNDLNPNPFTCKQIGLDGLKVNRLELSGDKLFALTNDGLYVMNINSEENFSFLGLEGKNILDIAILDNQHMLASYRKIDWREIELFESFDGGLSWSIKNHEFGSPDQPEAITDFYWDSENEVLFATGYGVLAKSLDRGTSWQPIWGDWMMMATSMMVEMNPNDPADIWIGGQGGIENGYLVQLRNESVHQEWFDLVPNPTVTKEIVFDNQTPQNIYVGWEGELNKTSDNGNTWTTLINRHDESHFFFGIGISQVDPHLVFTGKWAKGIDNQELTLYYSKDGGANWKEEVYSNEDKGGIFDLKIISSEDEERIFVACDLGGVYEITVNRKKLE